MKILDLKVMNGPNYWSVYRHKLIVMKLDLEELEDLPTDEIPGFSQRLQAMFPTMIDHFCSLGRPGGFFHRVKKGTWMGHVIEHIALELQLLAGMDAGFGRTRGTGVDGIYHVTFSYQYSEAGIYAAYTSLKIAGALTEGKDYDLCRDIKELQRIKMENEPGPSTKAILEEAEYRRIPYFRLPNGVYQLGYGANQKRISATLTSNTSCIAVDIAADKRDTKAFLEDMEIPVPKGKVVYSEESLAETLDKMLFPLVIKPLDGHQGKGATTNINSMRAAMAAFRKAKTYSNGVIVEKCIKGHDYRLLVINHKFVAASMRIPAMVKGDGQTTIQQLIDEINCNPRRGEGHSKELTYIAIDEDTKKILKDKKLGLNSILEKDKTLYLKSTANLSTGGTAVDFTEKIHPDNIFMAERISRITGLDVCGIDVIAHDLSKPLTEKNGAVIEVNAAPGFRMHLSPAEGKARNVAIPFLDMLFPKGSNPKIPLVAVTGTNGKTTTSRLVAHLAKQEGYITGLTTTDGIYINGKVIKEGDCAGPASGELILKDPTVEFAVLETARGGMLRSGLVFDTCDVGIVTNVTEDHLGINDIDTIEKLAEVKSIVARSVHYDGYAVLNADDDLVYAMAEEVHGKVALFSLDPQNPRIIKHCASGGLAAVLENGFITIISKAQKIIIEHIKYIPLTLEGRATFMIENILAAVLAAYTSNISNESIRKGLISFIPSAEHTPGRMNIFKYDGFEIMVDYAHNPAGIAAIGKFIKNTDATHKVGIITGVGDRRDEDITEIGHTAAQIFDEIILRMDKDMRGRSEKEMIDLLVKGIHKYDPNRIVSLIRDETEAIKYAMREAKKGSFICVFTEKVSSAVETVKNFKKEKSTKRRYRVSNSLLADEMTKSGINEEKILEV